MTQKSIGNRYCCCWIWGGGAAIAGELARNGRTTLIVEAGPKRTDPPGSHVRNNTPSEKKLPNELYLTAILFYGDVAGPRTCTFN